MSGDTTTSFFSSDDPGGSAGGDTFEWLLKALGGEVDGPAVPMLARPNAADPRLLIPLGTAAATAAAMRNGHDNRPFKTRALGAGGRLAGRLGVLHRLTGEVMDLPSTHIISRLRQVMGEPELEVSISAGPPRRNRKPVLMMIRPKGEIVGFAKVGWSPLTRSLTANEFSTLQMVDGRLPPPFRVPAPLHLIETGDLTVAVVSALQRPSLARPRTLLPEEIDQIGRSVGFRRTTVKDLDWLTTPTFGAREDSTDDRLASAVASVATAFAETELEVGLWHGDINPWNLLSSPEGIGVVDWEFAGLDRPVGQDRRHLRFESIRRVDTSPPASIMKRFIAEEKALSDSTAELAIYLADIAIRESRLSGQGWPGAMSGYRVPITAAIESLIS